MEFRILGPLEVTDASRSVPLDAPKQRALLGLLLLHPDEVVSSDRLIDELWGERPPASAGKLIQTYVSHLRKTIGADVIATRSPGYLFRSDSHVVDASQFRRLVSDARRFASDADPERADLLYREALGLWRGPPLADVAFESFARNEVERLEEERLDALSARVHCELALGQHEQLVTELETLVRQFPLREGLRAQLMLALYRCGRQADALEVYREGRRVLHDELGIEPGPALRDLEQAILRQEPALGAATAAPPPITQRRKRRWPVIAAGVTLAAAAIAAAILATGSSRMTGSSGSGGSRGAAEPIGYGVSFSEQLSTGAAGARPDLTLLAIFDDGRGSLRGLGSAPPPQTGEVAFRIARRQFEPDRGRSGVYDLLSDPAGTQIGYLSASPGGEDLVQQPLRKVGVSRDPKTGASIVRLAQTVSPAFRRLTGEPTLPVTVRIGTRDLVFAVDLQKVASRSAAVGSAFSFSWVSLHLFGSYPRLGQRGQAARNPSGRTRLHASVAARPCANATCDTLGATARDSALIVLPRELTVRAPRRAFYGQPVRFLGTGDPGDFVTIAYERGPGTAHPCTTADYQRPPDCAPRFRPALRKLTERRTRVAANGTWSLMLPLRSASSIPGPSQLPEQRSASGRYVAVEYSGRRIWGPWPPVGGSFSVVGEAPRATVVRLATPEIKLERRGPRREVAVSVKGADRFVHVVVRFRGAVIAAGTTNDHGVFTATIAGPQRRGILEARASAEGARPSTASHEVVPARA